MKEKIFNAALAGLLHDIGKLEQRSRDDPWTPASGFDKGEQPVHATWTYDFIHHNIPQIYQKIAHAGVYHHRPDKNPAEDRSLSYLVALADKLSAGERADIGQDGKQKDPPSQMVTVFDRISLDPNNASKDIHYLPLHPLVLDKEAIFPAHKIPKEHSIDTYRKLCEGLKNRLKEEISDRETFLENVLSALNEYTWCVPSAYYYSIPDVSLYDHSRMTAALAVCLTDFQTGEIEALHAAVQRDFLDKKIPEDDELLAKPAALLVGGDISGIQKFIYTLSSKGAAKTLRGRSFYLQLLTEALTRFVLRELGIPSTNVIYSGGGHFYLLAPLSASEKMDEVRMKVTRILLQHHGTDMYVALESVKVPASGFRLGNFPHYWGQMHTMLAIAKKRRYSGLPEEDIYSMVFVPEAHTGNKEKTCSVCGNEDAGVILLKQIDAEEEDSEARICPLCASFASEIGKDLVRARYVCLAFGEPLSQPKGTALDVLKELGMHVQFAGSADKEIKFTEETGNIERCVIWLLDDVKTIPPVKDFPAVPVQRYTVNQVTSKSFDELQKDGVGIERLGVLRMDVDDMGCLFNYGFSRDNKSIASLARLSTLSFQISLFFEGWVKKICEQCTGEVYAVYSGGDDLFLIAPWQYVPGLAQNIRRDLESFSSGNPDVHLSGGMSFIHGKYPLYQAAADAGNALDKAKSLEGKAAFTFLDQPYQWKSFDVLQQRFNKLNEMVSREKDTSSAAPQALLQVLQRLASLWKEKRTASKDNKPVWGRWMWMGNYQLARMAEQAEEHKKQQLHEDIQVVLTELKNDCYQDIHGWGVAARWAQLHVRQKKEKGKETG